MGLLSSQKYLMAFPNYIMTLTSSIRIASYHDRLMCIQNLHIHVRFQVLMALTIQVEVFWVVTPCSVVVGYQRFGGPFYLHLQGGTSVSYHQITRHHNQEDLDFNLQIRISENISPVILYGCETWSLILKILNRVLKRKFRSKRQEVTNGETYIMGSFGTYSLRQILLEWSNRDRAG
jgi:hypothetical protein